MKHRVKLSNGRTLLIEENLEEISLALEDRPDDEWFIASINSNGVLVYGNSGDACEELVTDLLVDVEA